MSPRSRIIWTTCGVALSILMPVLGIGVAQRLPAQILENTSFHASLETLGAILAILIAGILIIEQQTSQGNRDYFQWVAAGFAGMGFLDLLHASVQPGELAVWLHAAAILLGGTFFSLVWVGSHSIPWRHAIALRGGILLPTTAIALAIGMLVACMTIFDGVPALEEDSRFSPEVIVVNGLGGLGFLVSAVFFIRRFHRQYDITDWLLSLQTTLFGWSSLLVYFSSYWDLTWWWWHILRAIAYVTAFSVAVRSYLGVEKKLLQVNRKLHNVNLTLDEQVTRRTKELEEANAQLNRDRFLLNSLVDNVPDAVFFKDREGRFLKVNRAMATDAGIEDPGAFVGKTDADIWGGDLPREAGEDERQIMETGVPILNKEEMPVTPNGPPRWVLVTKMPLCNESGEIVGTFGVAREITKQKLAELQLRESETRFRLLVEHSPDASVTLDVDAGRFCDANRRAEELFKMSREEICRHHPVELSPEFQPGDIPSAQLGREMIEMALSGQRMVFDWVHRDSEGNDIPCEVRLVPLPFGDRNLVQATIADIGARKQAEQELTDARDAAREANRELRRARDVAEEASRAKNDFLAIASHEIRTPMHAIINMTDLVLGMQLTSEQREYLEIVAESAESLMSIIDQVLDFSRIESGKLELDAVEFTPCDEIVASVRSLAVRAKSKGLAIRCDVDPSVPDRLIGDPVRLRQVIWNLVGNAIKFTKQGEVAVKVKTIEEQADRVVLQFSVRDTGIGIPEEKLETIFNAFEQADTSTTREYGGTGLGLAISSRLVSAMDGELWVESCLAEGSTFYFTVKLMRVSGTGESRKSEFPNVTAVFITEHPVEQNEMVQMLNSMDVETQLRANPGDAVASLRQAVSHNRRPVLFLDDHKATFDVFTLVHQIRSDPVLSPSIVILITSDPTSSDERRFQELQIDYRLSNPVGYDQLARAINNGVPRGRNGRLQLAQTDLQSGGEPARPLSILLVEDGKANQTMAVGLLKKWGHSVKVAENGLQALDAVQQDQFDVILMDVQMPRMDGLEATERIREMEIDTGRHVPIIAMTAHAMNGDRERCLAVGMDEYLAKPVKKDELYRLLSVIAKRSAATATFGGEQDCPVDRDPSIIDWNAAAEILGGEAKLVERIVREAVNRMRSLLPNLRDALNQREPEHACRIVRAIHESAHTIVAGQVDDAAKDVERLVLLPDRDAVFKAFETLESAIARLESTVACSSFRPA